MAGITTGLGLSGNVVRPQFGSFKGSPFGGFIPGLDDYPLSKPASRMGDGSLYVPNQLRIPVIEGDGIGPEIMAQGKRLVNKAVELAYNGKKRIDWLPIEAGEKALAKTGKLIPDETIAAIKQHKIFLKGPLGTPVGGGFRSINVQLRKLFDTYACVRPVRNLPGVVTPMKVDNTNVVIFRENTEDVYKGIEFEKGNPITKMVITALNGLLRLTGQADEQIPLDSGVGIKPVSETASKRIIRQAFDYALKNGKPSVTVVHKGNIQKYTEGQFLKWAEELAKAEYGDKVITVDAFAKDYGWDYAKVPKGKFVLQNRIADAMFQEVIQNPQNHHVVVTTNLNGDYLSDAFAAAVGGLGVAPGANYGDEYAMFESTHGTAPDIAGKGIANPTALFLTMVMMLEYMGWTEAANKMIAGIETALKQHQMTGDLTRKIDRALPSLSTEQFTNVVIDAMEGKPVPMNTVPAKTA